MKKAIATFEKKNCTNCPDAKNKRCPLTCQLSLACPKWSEKPMVKTTELEDEWLFEIAFN